MITSLGYGTYFFFASLMVLMGTWAFFFVPETKGLTLEDMDKLFGVPERNGSYSGGNPLDGGEKGQEEKGEKTVVGEKREGSM